ncbi:MAG: phosphoribosylanthranilate isomerase [Verrucomicrobiota bacterium]
MRPPENLPFLGGAELPASRQPVRVKICGITTVEDAEVAIEAGADALGFNGYAGSKRFIDLAAADWISRLPSSVARVAVLVNPAPEEAKAVSNLPGIDFLQFHGHESPEFCRGFASRLYIKAVAARDREALQLCGDYSTPAILLDAFVPGAFGGTGKLIDLELAAEFVQAHPGLKVILSGGLTPDNVAEAVRAVRPYAVDVASGVESHPRKKDRSLMNDFIKAARSA